MGNQILFYFYQCVQWVWTLLECRRTKSFWFRVAYWFLEREGPQISPNHPRVVGLYIILSRWASVSFVSVHYIIKYLLAWVTCYALGTKKSYHVQFLSSKSLEWNLRPVGLWYIWFLKHIFLASWIYWKGALIHTELDLDLLTSANGHDISLSEQSRGQSDV